METIQNLGRRKLRNGLTISGILIGVLALTTMGSMAEKMSAFADGGERYYTDHVEVTDAARAWGGMVPLAKRDEIARVPGVVAAFAVVETSATIEDEFRFMNWPSILARQPGYDEHASYRLPIAEGRSLNATSRGEVVLGADLAKELGARVGGTVLLPKPPKEPRSGVTSREFAVVGIFERTFSQPDVIAMVSFPDGQRLLAASLPPAVRDAIDPATLATGIDAFGAAGSDLDELARRIPREVSGVKATPPSELVARFRSFILIFTAMTTAAALLALLIGGLSVVNTMTMAVAERGREIGLKKAIGARTGDILREHLFEAVAIGLIGGGLGVMAGWGVTAAINAATADQNISMFLLTPRLVAIGLGFSIGLGALAGILPAIRAARLDPVIALRAQ